MSDWVETTERLIQEDFYILEFEKSEHCEELMNTSNGKYENYFADWASKAYPELYGND